MNFVTSGRRARTQSATLTAPAHKATPTPPEVLSPDISVDSFQQANVMSTNSLASSMPSSLPLSASHDSAQIKDELSVADRQRSSSFTGKCVLQCVVQLVHLVAASTAFSLYYWCISSPLHQLANCCYSINVTK